MVGLQAPHDHSGGLPSKRRELAAGLSTLPRQTCERAYARVRSVAAEPAARIELDKTAGNGRELNPETDGHYWRPARVSKNFPAVSRFRVRLTVVLTVLLLVVCFQLGDDGGIGERGRVAERLSFGNVA